MAYITLISAPPQKPKLSETVKNLWKDWDIERNLRFTKNKPKYPTVKENSPSPFTGITPSLGLLSIASSLRLANHDVEYLQADYLLNSGGENKLIEEIQKSASRSNIIGVTCTTPEFHNAAKILSIAKNMNPEIITIMGGPHATSCPKETLFNSKTDVIILGEGEITTCELADSIKKKMKLENIDLAIIPGLTWLDKNDVLNYSESRPIANLNSIPSPAYDLIPYEIRHECVIGIETSRGCPFSCFYCSERRYWGKPRFKSQEKIKNDLEEYLRYFPKTNIYIYDSSFNVCKNHLKRCLPVLKESGATFACNVAALIDNNSLNNMSKSGITQICLGIETSSDEIIKIMNRPVSFSDCFNFIRIASDIIPFVRGNWIVGLPGQTKESLSLELSNLENILYNDDLLDVSPRPYVPYPGTLPFEFPDKYGITILSKHWPDYTRFSYPVYELDRLSADEIYQGFIDALKLTCYIPREIRLKSSNN